MASTKVKPQREGPKKHISIKHLEGIVLEEQKAFLGFIKESINESFRELYEADNGYKLNYFAGKIHQCRDFLNQVNMLTGKDFNVYIQTDVGGV